MFVFTLFSQGPPGAKGERGERVSLQSASKLPWSLDWGGGMWHSGGVHNGGLSAAGLRSLLTGLLIKITAAALNYSSFIHTLSICLGFLIQSLREH